MYKSSITLKKVALPVSIIAVVNILSAIFKSTGISIDDTYVWESLLSAYALYLGVRNWLKNRKKEPVTPVKGV